MIHVENLEKKFGRLKVLNGISLRCKPGTCIALIGPNGSGKTTLIKSILGMVVPDHGAITVRGEQVSGGWEYRSDIGYMPQISRYPENMSIGQVIRMIRDIRKNPVRIDESLIGSYGLEQLYTKKMGTLSGGTRQKVGACLAFLFDPSILILDEPTAGLDPVSAEVLKEKIRLEKAKGKVILLSSHILSELDELADEIIYMQDGKVLFQQGLQELRQETGEERLSRILAFKLKRTI